MSLRGVASLLLADDGTVTGISEPGLLRACAVAAVERRRLEADRGAVASILAAARLRAADAIVARVVSVDRDRADLPAADAGGPAGRTGFGVLFWRAAVAAIVGYVIAQIVRAAGADLPRWPFVAGIGALLFGLLTAGGRARERRLADAFGRISIHPVWGAFVLAGVLYLVYMLVGVLGAGVLVDLLQNDLFGARVNPWLRDALSAIPWRLARDVLVGPYGLLTMALTYALAIVLPIVTTFFVAFSILEDSGYLPRLAIMTDRWFRVIGLNGKAVLPMVLGLGCGTMATLTTRILETRKERILATFLLALGIPCSAQLGVIFGMFPMVGAGYGAVWLGTVLLTLLAAGWIAARVVPGERSDFLMEIPPIRRPLVSNLLLKTTARLEWYVKEAVPLFALGTLLLFILHETGALESVRRAGEPVVQRLLGLPPEASEAFLLGFLRRDYGATMLFDMASNGLLTHAQVVVAMVTITLFVPCVANVFMIWKERGAKVALAVLGLVFPIAFLVGGAVRVVLEAVS